MGGVVNGMAAHGGIVRPYGSTFLQFADYMRGAIRLSALTGLPVAWVYTHDSVGARRGRPDPPAGRAPRGAAGDPGARRSCGPRDATETAEAWRADRSRTSTGPRSSRSRARTCRPRAGAATRDGVGRGAYVLREGDGARCSSAPGAEVHTAIARGRPAGRRRRAGARGLDAVVGAVRRSRTTTTATSVLPRRRCRRSASRPGSRWAGSGGSTTASRSTASAPARRARRCSSSSASPPGTSPSVVREPAAGGARRAELASRPRRARARAARAARAARGPAVTWIAAGSRDPGDDVQRREPVEQELEGQGLGARGVARGACRRRSRSCARSRRGSPRCSTRRGRAGSGVSRTVLVTHERAAGPADRPRRRRRGSAATARASGRSTR